MRNLRSTFSRWFSEQSQSSHWLALILLSVGVGLLLAALHVPAALLLGPLLAAIVITVLGTHVQVPRPAFALAQGLIGCMIAKMLPTLVGGEVIGNSFAFCIGVVSVIAASGLLGWVMIRWRVLPGTTALWGLSPGAATAMTLMAEAHGADAQMVAFMQYLRVVLVAALASTIAAMWGGNGTQHQVIVTWFPSINGAHLGETLALAIAGPLLAGRFGLRAGALLIPVIAGIILTRRGLMTIELPHWLLAVAYSAVGWRIGLRFTRPLLLHAARALPRILACTVALIALCAGIAAVLVVTQGIDPLTAYLATSPGGVDTVAIIAASTHVDTHFVMAMQTARFAAVLILGPPLARLIAKHTELHHATQDA